LPGISDENTKWSAVKGDTPYISDIFFEDNLGTEK
jgi:hypothetical protein